MAGGPPDPRRGGGSADRRRGVGRAARYYLRFGAGEYRPTDVIEGQTGVLSVVPIKTACAACATGFVRFGLHRDAAAKFRFAPLQGALAARELPARGGTAQVLDTVYVLTADGRLLRKSHAVLFVLRELGGLWRVVALLRFMPVALADRVYERVAAVRYRVFGRFDVCAVPTAEERSRFVDANAAPEPRAGQPAQ